jgi:hypothetical protein
MCAAQLRLHSTQVHVRQSASRQVVVASPARPLHRSHARLNSWKTFGPSSHFNDGDADFFRLTNKLSDQYEWFAPRQDEEQAEAEVPQEEKPLYGLSPKQIAALGLSGSRLNTPDPVSVSEVVPLGSTLVAPSIV